VLPVSTRALIGNSPTFREASFKVGEEKSLEFHMFISIFYTNKVYKIFFSFLME
jgi:hypothetical protein